jgi:hypothetical protein
MDAHAAVRTFYGFFHNDRNTCNLMLDDFDGGKQVLRRAMYSVERRSRRRGFVQKESK